MFKNVEKAKILAGKEHLDDCFVMMHQYEYAYQFAQLP